MSASRPRPFTEEELAEVVSGVELNETEKEEARAKFLYTYYTEMIQYITMNDVQAKHIAEMKKELKTKELLLGAIVKETECQFPGLISAGLVVTPDVFAYTNWHVGVLMADRQHLAGHITATEERLKFKKTGNIESLMEMFKPVDSLLSFERPANPATVPPTETPRTKKRRRAKAGKHLEALDASIKEIQKEVLEN